MQKSGGGFGWLVAGSIVVLGLFCFLFNLRVEGMAVVKAQGSAVEKLDALRHALSALADAEKSAVLAMTEDSARVFVTEARAQRAAAEKAASELKALLEKSGTPAEKDGFAALSMTLDALRDIDDELLGLAEQQTNLKAYTLAYGPLAEEVARTTVVLERIVARAHARAELVAAEDARADLLRISVLLPPHIAESSAAKMDALEERMKQASTDLDHALEALPRGPERDEAHAGAERFYVLERQIISLSRQNTNVRALALSLDERRVAADRTVTAMDALAAVIGKTRADVLPSRLRR